MNIKKQLLKFILELKHLLSCYCEPNTSRLRECSGNIIFFWEREWEISRLWIHEQIYMVVLGGVMRWLIECKKNSDRIEVNRFFIIWLVREWRERWSTHMAGPVHTWWDSVPGKRNRRAQQKHWGFRVQGIVGRIMNQEWAYSCGTYGLFKILNHKISCVGQTRPQTRNE